MCHSSVPDVSRLRVGARSRVESPESTQPAIGNKRNVDSVYEEVTLSAAPRRRRRDAEENHARIVAAARRVLAEDGGDVAVGRIAAAAGVGVGTVYRHFPDKDALVDAVLDEAFGEIIAAAERGLDADDAWSGLVEFLEEVGRMHAVNSGLREIVTGSAAGRERAATMRRRLRPLLRRLVERAQQEGTLRADLAPEDVPMILWATARVVERAGAVAPDAWRRLLGLVLDGLRADAATPLPAPALTTAQLDRIAPSRS